MLKMYLDGELLYHPNIPDKLPMATAKWDGEVGKAGKLEFLILKQNPMYGNIRKMKSIVKLYDDNYRIFRGRVYSARRKFNNSLLVTCEGELAFLNDAEVRPYSFKGSVEDYFYFLVDEYNSQVSEDRRFLPGRCTVTDPNNYIVRENKNYPKVLKEMQDKLVDKLGGFLWTREETDGVYIDYLADFELTNTQKIVFGENLLNLDDFIKGNEIATAIRPLGAYLTDEEGNETDERLTIKSVNNDVDYIFSQDAVDSYGWIYRTVIFDDVTVASNLLKKGKNELENSIHLTQSIELSAVDLHMMNRSIQNFRLGRYTIVESPPHGFNDVFLTRKQSINILKPVSDGILTLGDERKTFVDKQVGTGNRLDIAFGKLEESTVKIDELKKTTTRQYTEVINDSKEFTVNALKSYVKEDTFSSYQEEVSSQFKQTAENISMNFETTTKDINNVDGDLQQKWNKLVKHIKFSGETAIEITSDGSTIALEIDNEKGIIFKKNGVEFGSWDGETFHTGNVMIDVDERAQFGDFAFMPRDDGSLSFLKVGGE